MTNKTILLLCLAVFGIVALTGCSSSKGVSYNRFNTPLALVGADTHDGAAGALAGSADAQATNQGGSVTQAAGNRQVHVAVSGSGGAPTIAVYYNDANQSGDPLVTTEEGEATPNVYKLFDKEDGTEAWQRLRLRIGRGVEFYKRLAAGGDFLAGDLWVDVFTDYTGTDDTDYLAGGFWLFVPEDPTDTSDYSLGAFVDGSDPFDSADLTALTTGTAEYKGNAAGVFTNLTDSQAFFFNALVSLEANFDTDVINGMIHDFTVNGNPVSGEPELTLAQTSIANPFFTGTTSMTFNMETYTGDYGGQFYGNNEDDEPPGSVAGTFGAATNDDEESLLGVFTGHRE